MYYFPNVDNENSTLVTCLARKWKLIPLTWRGWWIFFDYAGLTMHYPPPEAVDVTIDRNELISALSTLLVLEWHQPWISIWLFLLYGAP
jgi:hypothetical protein